jgi:hypothetical protein
MTSNRLLLALGALGVVAAVVVLYIALRGDDGPAAPAEGSGSAVAQRDPAPPVLATPDRPGAPVVTPSERDRTPRGGDAPRETVVNGVRVRDHRGGSGSIDLPRNIHPPDSRKLMPETVGAINEKMYGLLRECMASVPREGRNPQSRIEGTIVVAVKSKLVTVTQSTMQVREAGGTELEPARQCMEQRALGLAVDVVADEQDVDAYSIMVDYALP